jgi:hypothetical protein
MKIVPNSSNRKLGRGVQVTATYRKVGPTCLTSCGLLDAGCYAQRGFTRFAQPKTDERVSSKALQDVPSGKLLRLLVSGDILTEGEPDKGFAWAVRDAVDRRVETWGYTHAWKQTWPEHWGNALLASCDSLADAQEAQKAGWCTARVVNSLADVAENETACPYDAALASRTHAEIKVTCADCRMCFRNAKRNIAFLKF